MPEVSVIIPNYNGMAYLDGVLASLEKQTMKNFEILVVDNGSSDESCAFVQEHYPQVRLVRLPQNLGFAQAVNEGVRRAKAPLVLLLNNDTEADPRFVQEMREAICRHKKAFSCSARMVQYYDRSRLDGAGDCYCALGWAFARGKGKPVCACEREEQIFSSCAGAAIYRKKLLIRIGWFDEAHFAYLEDLDVGYRARIYGYENWYAPRAVVYHVGSGTTGSRYNSFKTRYSSRNNIYLIYKNMPMPQILLNLPLLACGFALKLLFFAGKGMGREYAAGIKNGFQISRREKKVPFAFSHLPNYGRIQWALWVNLFRRI